MLEGTGPDFLYGTAWKEDRTEELVRLALASGFRGLDTANQRRHYVEAAVGEAVADALTGGIAREELFLQTKFTSLGGQDRRLPYDPAADPATQVRQSFESSLVHLRTTYVDSYVLHGPSSARGLTDEDWEVWRAMEELHRTGAARRLGISNVSLE
ncbi:MAG TPA: aldo/keto reductase, partial [Vicinamibacteria bacterium]|nr:aldo/keto reductase [Vicinamibacteria bacterium]